MHADEIVVTTTQVRALVAEQLPQLGHLTVSKLDTQGTVNAIFRLGEIFAARFPLRADDPSQVATWLQREAAAASELAECSPVPVPKPIHIGDPGHGYPLPWAVQTWVDGTPATPDGAADATGLAHDLVVFIGALRHGDTRGRRFSGGGRGGTLSDHDSWMQECFRQSASVIDIPPLRRLWSKFRLLRRDCRDVMSHTDLTPGNILVTDGRLAGVLDGGGYGPADPALDLVCAWHLLAPGPREALRRGLRCSDLEWERGRAWAFEQAMGAYWYYLDSNPAMSLMGKTTLGRILEEQG